MGIFDFLESLLMPRAFLKPYNSKQIVDFLKVLANWPNSVQVVSYPQMLIIIEL